MLPPIIQRELRVALLRRNARKEWLQAAWTASGATLFSMAILGLASNRPGGRMLFRLLFALGTVAVVTRGLGLTAALLSEERRNGTLGLVVLTGLRPLEIFVYKLFGALFLSTYALLGGLPFFAVPFLAGGVPASQFLCAMAFLGNGLLFCVAMGLLTSVLNRDGGQAQLMGQAITLALCVLAPLLHWLALQSGRPTAFPSGWLALSPAYPPYLVFAGFTPGSFHLFWAGSAVTLIYSLAALLAAALILQRTWRDVAETPARSWRERWLSRTRGGRRWRERLRVRLLAREPFCWLAARDRPPALLGYGVLVFGMILWLAGWSVVGRHWLQPVQAFISSFVLHQFLNVVIAFAAGRRFAEERLSGGFEILLTAPLNAKDIVDGQYKAVLVQFRGVGALALLFDLFLCWTSLAVALLSRLETAVYVLVWGLVLCYWFAMHLASASRAMWIGCWTGRPAYAAIKAAGGYWSLMIWLWILSQSGPGAFLRLSPYHLVFGGLAVIAILTTLGTRGILRQKLTRELRLITAAPIPARGDSRFKNWDPEKIFPPDPARELMRRPGAPRRPRGRMDTLNG